MDRVIVLQLPPTDRPRRQRRSGRPPFTVPAANTLAKNSSLLEGGQDIIRRKNSDVAEPAKVLGIERQ